MKTSVALCTYNGEKFLGQQIDSILNQTKKVDEIVVCDDGSTDATVTILHAYQERHPDLFKIYINEKNLRSVKNFEKAISLCRNEIIFLSDQDDVWLPEKVADYCSFFEQNPQISVLCSNGFAIDEENKILNKLSVWEVPEILKNQGYEPNLFEITAFIRNIATGATMAFRKNFVGEIMPFPVIMDFHHDEWIALVSSFQKKFHLLSKKYIQYRVHENQMVGGVFLDPNKKSKEYLQDFFSFNMANGNFKTYRKLLRSLSNSIVKFSSLKNNSPIQQELISQSYLLAHEKYRDLKKRVKEEFPIQSIFLK